MLNSKYHKGLTSLVHDNGRGRSYWDHHNPQVTLAEAMDDCYFDLGNKNRGNNPMYRPGHMITIDARDGMVQVRVMSMGPDYMGIAVKPVAPPMYFDDAEPDFGVAVADETPGKVQKKRGRRPKSAAIADELVDAT